MPISISKNFLRLLLHLILFIGSTGTTQSQTVELPLVWKFCMGDDPAWAATAWNDSLWGTKTVGSSWSATDLKGDVYAWYRARIVIPSAMKQAIEKGNGLKIRLGTIDDVDQTYFNGKLIGQTGSFPPDYVTKWDAQREYFISPHLICYDKENIVAVRVFSPDIGGVGMYQGPYTYGPVQWTDYVDVTAVLSDSGQNSFGAGIRFANRGFFLYQGILEYFIRDKKNTEVYKESREILIQPFGSGGIVAAFPAYRAGKEDFVTVGFRFTERESQTAVTREQFYLANKQIDIPAADVPKPPVENKISDVYSSIPFHDQQLNGYLGERTALNCEERIVKVDEDGIIGSYLQRPGTHPWIGEHIGKYLEAASNAWKLTHDVRVKKQMDRMMYTLINTQLADGYLGTYAPGDYWTSWDVWSHKYNIIGLLAYYSATGYQPALETSKKMGDLLCTTFGNASGQRDILRAGEHLGMAATSVLEPMVELYRLTGDEKYLKFCSYIVGAYEQKYGPKIISSLMENGQVYMAPSRKAYELLSNIVGLVKLYRVTGDQKYLQPALLAWQDVVAKRLYITGTTSSLEHFQDDGVLPGALRDNMGEGCVTVTWIQLNHILLSVTGEARFADQIEKTIYNHLLAAENPIDGQVSYYTPLMDKKPFIRNISCCQSSIPRGIAMIPYFTIGTVKGIPTVMLYEPASYRASVTEIGGRNIDLSLHVTGKFPESGDITILVKTTRNASYPLALRVPSWCTTFTAETGGKRYRGIPGQYLTIDRAWKSNDKITIAFDMPVVTLGGGKSYPNLLAFQRGPQVLAYDRDLNEVLIVDTTRQRYVQKTLGVKNKTGVLPKGWIGKQSYAVSIGSGKMDPVKKELILVPYADASQTGGAIRVWLPIGIPVQ